MPFLDRRLILDPYSMLLVIRRIRIVASNIHQILINANILGVAEMGAFIFDDARDVEALVDEGVQFRLLHGLFGEWKAILKGEDGLDASDEFADP